MYRATKGGLKMAHMPPLAHARFLGRWRSDATKLNRGRPRGKTAGRAIDGLFLIDAKRAMRAWNWQERQRVARKARPVYSSEIIKEKYGGSAGRAHAPALGKAASYTPSPGINSHGSWNTWNWRVEQQPGVENSCAAWPWDRKNWI
jgi:hypothetical protein